MRVSEERMSPPGHPQGEYRRAAPEGALVSWVQRAAAALLCAAAPALAAPGAAVEAGDWLARMQRAAANQTYQGNLMFSAAGVVSSSRVAHFSDGRHRYERIDALDGREARHQYRHNDQTLTVWPQSRVAVQERQDPVAAFPSLPAAGAQALENYELRTLGSDRIAGHEADVLLLKPRDGHRFAQRLWAERDSGLLLRSDVLGPAGEVLESSAFTDVVIGGKLSVDSVTKPMRRLDGYRVVRPETVRVAMEAEGWVLARPVPGFALVNCMRRPLDAVSEGGAQVLQSVYSDGLTHVSVFIEPFDAQRHRAMRTALGATNTSMNRHGDWWVTIVGGVPMSTVQLFEAALQRRP